MLENRKDLCLDPMIILVRRSRIGDLKKVYMSMKIQWTSYPKRPEMHAMARISEARSPSVLKEGEFLALSVEDSFSEDFTRRKSATLQKAEDGGGAENIQTIVVCMRKL